MQGFLQNAVSWRGILAAIAKSVRWEGIEDRMKKRLKLKKVTIRDLDDNSLETVVGGDVSNTCLNCPPPTNVCVTQPFTQCGGSCGATCNYSCVTCQPLQ